MALFKIHRNETQNSVFPEKSATEGYCYFHDKTGRFVVDLVTITKTVHEFGVDAIELKQEQIQYKQMELNANILTQMLLLELLVRELTGFLLQLMVANFKYRNKIKIQTIIILVFILLV